MNWPVVSVKKKCQFAYSRFHSSHSTPLIRMCVCITMQTQKTQTAALENTTLSQQPSSSYSESYSKSSRRQSSSCSQVNVSWQSLASNEGLLPMFSGDICHIV